MLQCFVRPEFSFGFLSTESGHLIPIRAAEVDPRAWKTSRQTRFLNPGQERDGWGRFSNVFSWKHFEQSDVPALTLSSERPYSFVHTPNLLDACVSRDKEGGRELYLNCFARFTVCKSPKLQLMKNGNLIFKEDTDG